MYYAYIYWNYDYKLKKKQMIAIIYNLQIRLIVAFCYQMDVYWMVPSIIALNITVISHAFDSVCMQDIFLQKLNVLKMEMQSMCISVERFYCVYLIYYFLCNCFVQYSIDIDCSFLLVFCLCSLLWLLRYVLTIRRYRHFVYLDTY